MIEKVVTVDVSFGKIGAVPYKYDTGLIIGTGKVISKAERLRQFTSVDEMKKAGFTIEDAEMKAANLYFMQRPRPLAVYVAMMEVGEQTAEPISVVFKDCIKKGAAFYGVYLAKGTDAQKIELQQSIEEQDDYYQFISTNQALVQEAPTLFASLNDQKYWRWTGFWNEEEHAGAALLGYSCGMNRESKDKDYTLSYKTLQGIIPSTFSAEGDSEYTPQMLKASGVSIYASFGNTEGVFPGDIQGKNNIRYNEVMQIDRTVNDAKVNCFNVLAGAKTKIPQTDEGMAQLKAAVVRACNEASLRGALATREWEYDSNDIIEKGEVIENGYLVRSGSYLNMTPQQRAQKQSAPLYAVLALSGNAEIVALSFDIIQ